MDQFKICMLGAHHAGKTSLVNRFVSGTYSSKPKSTLGVRIDKKQMQTTDGPLELIIWDMAGANKYQQIQTTYLRNASAYVLVVDQTRPQTAEAATDLHEKAQQVAGSLPFLLVVNKCDAGEPTNDGTGTAPAWGNLMPQALATIHTSALHGGGVNDAFELLASTLQQQLHRA